MILVNLRHLTIKLFSNILTKNNAEFQKIKSTKNFPYGVLGFWGFGVLIFVEIFEVRFSFY